MFKNSPVRIMLSFPFYRYRKLYIDTEAFSKGRWVTPNPISENIKDLKIFKELIGDKEESRKQCVDKMEILMKRLKT